MARWFETSTYEFECPKCGEVFVKGFRGFRRARAQCPDCGKWITADPDREIDQLYGFDIV